MNNGFAQNIIYNQNFNDVQTGFYNKSKARTDLGFPGCKGADEGRVSVENFNGQGKVLKIKYPKGGVKTNNSGFFTKVGLPGEHEELFISYKIFIPSDFEFRAGAKIPGLAHQPSNGKKNTSLRLMWRKDGLVEYYLHYRTRPSTSIQVNWTLTDPYDQVNEPYPDQVKLVKGTWNTIEMQIKLNTPGVKNGIMRGWLNGKLAIDITDNGDYRLSGDTDIKLNQIYMTSFFGGSDETFQPTKDQYAYFDDFIVSKTRIGTGGNTNTPPVVSLTSPSAGDSFNEASDIEVKASASDSDGQVSKVEFYNGSVKLGEDSTAPYSYIIKNAAVGVYNLNARAIDNKGASATSRAVNISVINSTDNIPPSVEIVSPSNGAVFNKGESVSIIAAANDIDGSVEKVEFFSGSIKIGEKLSKPYSFDLTNPSVGNYTIYAKATDDKGATTNSKSISFTLKGTIDPDPDPSNCKFGTPLSTSLPGLNRVSYTNVYVLGKGGPDLSQIRKFTINWDPRYNGLYQFAFNTTNGKPAYYISLKNKVSHNFGSSQPSVTIRDSGLSGLDGEYWVAKDGDNFVMVSKSAGYTIYFSNSSTPPNCSGKSSNVPSEYETTLSVYPNPAFSILNISDSKLSRNVLYTVSNISGQILLQQNFNASQTLKSLDVSGLQSGIYFLTNVNSSKIIKFIKE